MVHVSGNRLSVRWNKLYGFQGRRADYSNGLRALGVRSAYSVLHQAAVHAINEFVADFARLRGLLVRLRSLATSATTEVNVMYETNRR